MSPEVSRQPCVFWDPELRLRRAEPLVAVEDKAADLQSPEATRSRDCSSDASFITAVEDPPQPGCPSGTQGLVVHPWLSCGAVETVEEAPSCQLQALKLTTEATGVPSLLGDRDLRASHPHGPVPPMSDLQLLQALRALGHSPGPVTPFTRGYYLRRLQEAQASPGESLGGIPGVWLHSWNPEALAIRLTSLPPRP